MGRSTFSSKGTIGIRSNGRVCTSEDCNNPPIDLMNVSIHSNRNGSSCKCCKEDLEKHFNSISTQNSSKDSTPLEITIKWMNNDSRKYSFYGMGNHQSSLDKINASFIGWGVYS